MRLPITPALMTGAMLALAACTGEPAAPAAEAPAPAPAPTSAQTPAHGPAPAPADPVAAPPIAPAPVAGPTVGGDGSEIRLSALSAAEIAGAKLTGELACAFATKDAPVLLIANGDVASKDPAFGVVKVGDYVERVAAPGGFDAMLKGATFSGQGKTIRIALTGKATGGGESPPSPATLTYQRADGAERTFAGTWTCGP